jgi:hypothetical protein
VKRRSAAAERATAALIAQVRADHQKVRAEILALCPGWSATALESVTHSWGSPADPGLVNISSIVQAYVALEKKFGGGQ